LRYDADRIGSTRQTLDAVEAEDTFVDAAFVIFDVPFQGAAFAVGKFRVAKFGFRLHDRPHRFHDAVGKLFLPSSLGKLDGNYLDKLLILSDMELDESRDRLENLPL
jgi:hypothetical protein